MKEKKKKEKKSTLPILCMVGPTSLWLLFFLLIPLIYVVVISFMTKGAYGGVVGKFSIDSYKKIFDPLYLTCLLYTSPSPRDLSTSRMPSSA